MAEVVTTVIARHARIPAHRTLDEALFVRWPGLSRNLTQTVMRLPPRSRLRRAALKRGALSGWGAWLRRDFDLMTIRFAPDYTYEPPAEWVAVGMRCAYRGHTGLREWAADMFDAWEWLENRPLEIVDGGGPVVFVNRIRLRARGSGVEFDYRAGLVIWMEGGLIVRERDFLDAGEALRAVGIPAAA